MNDEGQGPEADLDEIAVGDREQHNDERNRQPDQHAECSCDKGSTGHNITVNAILIWTIGDQTHGAKPRDALSCCIRRFCWDSEA